MDRSGKATLPLTIPAPIQVVCKGSSPKFDNASNQLGAVSPTGRLVVWCREPQMKLLLATRLHPLGLSVVAF